MYESFSIYKKLTDEEAKIFGNIMGIRYRARKDSILILKAENSKPLCKYNGDINAINADINKQNTLILSIINGSVSFADAIENVWENSCVFLGVLEQSVFDYVQERQGFKDIDMQIKHGFTLSSTAGV